MPNRILRDWTDSYAVDDLDAEAERFFTRLIMKVDDFGRFHADPRLLRAQLFPLKGEKIRDSDITAWLAACNRAGLVRCYGDALGRNYVEILKFNQRLRLKRPSRFPAPSEICPTDDGHLAGMCPPETKRNETETKRNELESSAGALPAPILTDVQWLGVLKGDPTYDGIDVDREHGKMVRWCEVNGKKATRRRFLNWLNRADRPMNATPRAMGKVGANEIVEHRKAKRI